VNINLKDDRFAAELGTMVLKYIHDHGGNEHDALRIFGPDVVVPFFEFLRAKDAARMVES
jgi:hypothetical protein